MTHLDDVVLWQVLAGELEAERAAGAEAHLDACASCRDRLEGLRAARIAARALGGAEPTPFASARMKRSLSAGLDREVRVQRHAWRPSRVAAAIAFATVSGAAVAMTASGAWRERPSSPGVPTASTERRQGLPPAARGAPAEPRADDAPPGTPEPSAGSEHPVAALEAEEPELPSGRSAHASAKRPPRRLALSRTRTVASPEAPEGSSKARPGAARLPDGPRVSLAAGTPTPRQVADRARARLQGSPGAEGWVSVGDLYAQAGEPDAAAGAYIQGLGGPEAGTASERLRRLAQDAASEAPLLDAIAAAPDARESAEGLRLLCEWGLKVRGDRQAVAWCQAFGRAFPAHPAVHALALAAGQAAETRLEDLKLAVAEYSRALVVSEFADLPTSEALLYRARALSRLGNDEEAQADLRLYLHVDPTASRRPEVAALARSLGVPLPR